MPSEKKEKEKETVGEWRNESCHVTSSSSPNRHPFGAFPNGSIKKFAIGRRQVSRQGGRGTFRIICWRARKQHTPGQRSKSFYANDRPHFIRKDVGVLYASERDTSLQKDSKQKSSTISPSPSQNNSIISFPVGWCDFNLVDFGDDLHFHSVLWIQVSSQVTMWPWKITTFTIASLQMTGAGTLAAARMLFCNLFLHSLC